MRVKAVGPRPGEKGRFSSDHGSVPTGAAEQDARRDETNFSTSTCSSGPGSPRRRRRRPYLEPCCVHPPVDLTSKAEIFLKSKRAYATVAGELEPVEEIAPSAGGARSGICRGHGVPTSSAPPEGTNLYFASISVECARCRPTPPPRPADLAAERLTSRPQRVRGGERPYPRRSLPPALVGAVTPFGAPQNPRGLELVSPPHPARPLLTAYRGRPRPHRLGGAGLTSVERLLPRSVPSGRRPPPCRSDRQTAPGPSLSRPRPGPEAG
jgi:hypothetical protein